MSRVLDVLRQVAVAVADPYGQQVELHQAGRRERVHAVTRPVPAPAQATGGVVECEFADTCCPPGYVWVWDTHIHPVVVAPDGRLVQPVGDAWVWWYGHRYPSPVPSWWRMEWRRCRYRRAIPAAYTSG